MDKKEHDAKGDLSAEAVTGIIIDPGHGGKDGGGGTNQFWKESNYVLQISLYQYKRFQELGIPVKITRTTDVYLSPDERTKIVRNSGMKHCISNHVNAGGGDGAEFIHSIFSSSKMADLMAEEIKAVGQNVRRVFTRKLDNGKDYYFMHRETGAVETVIGEYGFADSTKDDVIQLRNNQIKYAEAIVKAYCRYIGKAYQPPFIEKPVPTVSNPAPSNSTPSNTAPSGKLYKVQAGAFKDEAGAKARVEALKKVGFDAYYILQ
ncbi:N-acetylmuramoyl-L-alanine amidase [Bacillaceae bacterium C204]|uniref:N-acetylmuramoyl-L-alanine amidase n=1 Tax=Neobacillus sp. 204 TaxID=3383351 RepID=UPI00397DA6C7